MAMRNGHLNGSGQHDEEDNKVTSLEEARKRAAEKAKAAARAKRTGVLGGSLPGNGEPRTLKDWIIGGLFILMALALIVSFVLSFLASVKGGGR